MFNFTTDTILNSVSLYDAATKKGNVCAVGADKVIIEKVGTFRKSEIVSIYRTEAQDEVKASQTIEVPAPASNDVNSVYRICIDLGLVKSTSSLYAVFDKDKNKPIFAEAIAESTTASDLAAKLASNLGAYMNLVYDRPLVEVSVAGAVITVQCTDGHQVINSIKIEKWVADADTFAGGSWALVKSADKVEGKPGFGTYKYLMHNHRLPTYENIHYMSPNSVEAPVLEGKYTQYVICQRSVRSPYGVGAVGQELVSVTNHVIWVLESGSNVTTFNNLLGKLGTIEPTTSNATVDAIGNVVPKVSIDTVTVNGGAVATDSTANADGKKQANDFSNVIGD